MTHTCFQCKERFPNSGMLVQHMRQVHQSFVDKTQARIPRNPQPEDRDRYRNTVATCPFCQIDCNTRKKLMQHLELEHKNSSEDESGPTVKVIKLDSQNKQDILNQLSNVGIKGNLGNNGSSSTTMQNLIQAISSSSSSKVVGVGKVDKPAAKLQYKCFWCDESFRKRGKLMDHIDLLHKQNKAQTEVEAEMINIEDQTQKLQAKHLATQTPSTSSQPHTPICSFISLGELSDRPKAKEVPEVERTNICTFFFGKKDNPVATRQLAENRRVRVPEQRRQDTPFMYASRMMTHSPMVAMHPSYMFSGIRPPMQSAYFSRMPLLSPGYMMSQQPMLKPDEQFYARMNVLASMQPGRMPRHMDPSETALDLTTDH